MQSTSAKTLIDVHCGLKFAKSPRWIGQQLLFLDIHDKCIKSAELNGTVQTVRTLSYLPGGFGVLAESTERSLRSAGACPKNETLSGGTI